jgi:hypothetical protein
VAGGVGQQYLGRAGVIGANAGIICCHRLQIDRVSARRRGEVERVMAAGGLGAAVNEVVTISY